MAKLKIPGIPAILGTIPKEIQSVLRPMKEILQAFTDPTNPVLRVQTLVDAGIVGGYNPGNGTVTPGSPELDTTPPPAPTGLAAGGALANVILSWDAAVSDNIAHTEVWRAETNDIGVAVKIGTAPGQVYVDPLGAAATRYYWIRYLSRAGISGPFNAQAGVMGQTGSDPAYLLDLLTGQITTSQLYTTLAERIAHIDVIDSQIATLSSSVSDLSGTPDYNNAATYAADDLVKYGGGLYRAIGATTGNLPTNTTYWEKIGDYASLSDAVAGHSAQLIAHDTRITNTESGVVAVANRATVLETAVNHSSTGLATKASVTYVDTAISTEQGARATAINSLRTEYQGEVAAVEQLVDTFASDIAGLQASYTVKIDIAGRIAGFGLAGSANNATPLFDFGVRTDKFFIAPPTDYSQEEAPNASAAGKVWYKPSTKVTYYSTAAGTASWTAVAPTLPFVVQTTAQTVNGVVIPAGVYMDAAYIKNMTAAIGRLGNAWIDNAMIANLDAGKITAGDIAAVRMQAHIVEAVEGKFNYLSAIAAQLGTVQINASGFLRSASATAYDSGIGFWLGYHDGAYKFRVGNPGVGGKGMFWDGTNITFSGALNAATGTFSGDISGANGNFRGQVTGGAYTSYAWPAVGQRGFYIGPSGLLLGNGAGGGRYLQFDQASGNIWTNATLSGADGTFSGSLTAQVVTTDNIISDALADADTFPGGAPNGTVFYVSRTSKVLFIATVTSEQPGGAEGGPPPLWGVGINGVAIATQVAGYKGTVSVSATLGPGNYSVAVDATIAAITRLYILKVKR